MLLSKPNNVENDQNEIKIEQTQKKNSPQRTKNRIPHARLLNLLALKALCGPKPYKL
jgi:hypothetical protein